MWYQRLEPLPGSVQSAGRPVDGTSRQVASNIGTRMIVLSYAFIAPSTLLTLPVCDCSQTGMSKGPLHGVLICSRMLVAPQSRSSQPTPPGPFLHSGTIDS